MLSYELVKKRVYNYGFISAHRSLSVVCEMRNCEFYLFLYLLLIFCTFYTNEDGEKGPALGIIKLHTIKREKFFSPMKVIEIILTT